MNDYNDFGEPERVTLRPYKLPVPDSGSYVVELPAKSVVLVQLTVGG